MVHNVTSLTGNGLRDWLIQRISAVVLTFYTLFLFGFVLFHPHLDLESWRALFSSIWMKLFTLIAVLNLILHSWIGIWTVTTDYLKNFSIRLMTQSVVFFALLIYFFYTIVILWG
jgi:succinate dehydrogenase / fumarate reductase membrane anchor subunit